MSTEIRHYTLQKAANGYIVQMITRYGNDGEAEIYHDFATAIEGIAKKFGEHEFASTVIQAQAMAAAMTSICSSAVAPKLTAIEAKLNPGKENVVDDIQF